MHFDEIRRWGWLSTSFLNVTKSQHSDYAKNFLSTYSSFVSYSLSSLREDEDLSAFNHVVVLLIIASQRELSSFYCSPKINLIKLKFAKKKNIYPLFFLGGEGVVEGKLQTLTPIFFVVLCFVVQSYVLFYSLMFSSILKDFRWVLVFLDHLLR